MVWLWKGRRRQFLRELIDWGSLIQRFSCAPPSVLWSSSTSKHQVLKVLIHQLIQLNPPSLLSFSSFWMVCELGINFWGYNVDVHLVLAYVRFFHCLCICPSLSAALCFSSFMRALEAHGLSRDDLPYKAPFQPWGSWFALGSTLIITIFKGFDSFLPFNTANFIT